MSCDVELLFSYGPTIDMSGGVAEWIAAVAADDVEVPSAVARVCIRRMRAARRYVFSDEIQEQAWPRLCVFGLAYEHLGAVPEIDGPVNTEATRQLAEIATVARETLWHEHSRRQLSRAEMAYHVYVMRGALAAPAVRLIPAESTLLPDTATLPELGSTTRMMRSATSTATAAAVYVRLVVEHALDPVTRAQFSDTEHVMVLANAHPTRAEPLAKLCAECLWSDVDETEPLAMLAETVALLVYAVGGTGVRVAVDLAAARDHRGSQTATTPVRVVVWSIAGEIFGATVYGSEQRVAAGTRSRHVRITAADDSATASRRVRNLLAWTVEQLGALDTFDVLDET